jgi:predicted AAA+ superfamily ATPase
MAEINRRIIEDDLVADLREVPALFIEGAKGVGKTLTSRGFAKTFLQLDKPAVREALANDTETIAQMEPPVLIDEWQFVPEVWNTVRRLVDDGAPPGSFILTGSVSQNRPELHSGAGRILTERMRPLSLFERLSPSAPVSLGALLAQATPFSQPLGGTCAATIATYADEIVKSGLPGIRKYGEDRAAKMLKSYIEYAVTRDFTQEGISVRKPALLRRWLRSYAAATATDAGYSEILDGATAGDGDKISKPTALAYRAALERLWLLDELQPWLDGGDYFSRLKQTPRHHLADPALACSLLGIDTADLLAGRAETRFDAKHGTFAGRLFESLLVQSVQTYAAANSAAVSYFRTQNGDREVDIIVQKKRRVVALEVKLSPTVNDADVRHLVWLKTQLGKNLADAAVLTTGSECYRRKKDGIAVIPAALLGP